MLTMARAKIWMGERRGPAMMLQRFDPFLPITTLSSPSRPRNSMLLSELRRPYSFMRSNFSLACKRVVIRQSTSPSRCSWQSCLSESVGLFLGRRGAVAVRGSTAGQQSTRFLLFCKVVPQAMVARRAGAVDRCASTLNSLRSRLEVIVHAWQNWWLFSRCVVSQQVVRCGRKLFYAAIRSFIMGRLSIHSQKRFSVSELQTCTSKICAVFSRRGVNIRLVMVSGLLLSFTAYSKQALCFFTFCVICSSDTPSALAYFSESLLSCFWKVCSARVSSRSLPSSFSREKVVSSLCSSAPPLPDAFLIDSGPLFSSSSSSSDSTKSSVVGRLLLGTLISAFSSVGSFRKLSFLTTG